MNVEHLQLTRRIRLIPGTPRTFSLESGTPYRHTTMWVRIHSDAAVNVTAQPQFGGINDGAASIITDNIPTKVFQVTVEEVRPATRFNRPHSNDNIVVESIKSELLLTNTLSTALVATYTWNTTTTITSADTSEVVIGEYIRLDSDGQWFLIIDIDPNVSVTISNPNGLVIPTGATQSSKSNETELSAYLLATATPGGA
jgi:hypothetical protein